MLYDVASMDGRIIMVNLNSAMNASLWGRCKNIRAWFPFRISAGKMPWPRILLSGVSSCSAAGWS